MNGPGAYAFKRGEKILYIGSTRDLSKRPIHRDRGHKSRWQAILRSDNVELFPCESIVEAQQLEESLVRKHRPLYNLRMPHAPADLARTWQIIQDNW